MCVSACRVMCGVSQYLLSDVFRALCLIYYAMCDVCNGVLRDVYRVVCCVVESLYHHYRALSADALAP